MSLWSDFLTNNERLIHKWTHYMPAYERHLQRFVDRPLTLLEIGCGEGGSLQMWKRYFGPYAHIVGVDIDPRCKDFEEEQISVRIGSQADERFLSELISEFGEFDVVIDDGSHTMEHVVTSFKYLYPRLDKNGVYIVEDLHTAYWAEYGGGLHRQGTFIELCKELLDELNADWCRGALLPTDFTRSTLSMHFYDSLAIFEKGRHQRKHAPRIGRVAKPGSQNDLRWSNQATDNEGPQPSTSDQELSTGGGIDSLNTTPDLPACPQEPSQDTASCIEILESALAREHAAYQRIEEERDRLKTTMDRILHSHSWRLTAPIRNVARILRKRGREPD